MGNSNSNSANSSTSALSGGKGTSSSGGNHSKSNQNGHTSSSASTKTAVGTLSHSVASSLTTDTSTTAEQSSNGGGSSLGTSQTHSAVTTDEETQNDVRGLYYENRQHFYHHHSQQQQQQQQQPHHFPNTSRSWQYKHCSSSTDSLTFTDVNFVDSHSHQHQQQLPQHGSHYSLSDAGLHTASSFELVQPTEEDSLFRAATAVEPLSLLPQYRPHSVLGLNEPLHHSMSSCASSVTSTATSTDSCCSSAQQSSLDEDYSSSHYSRIEHYHQRASAAPSFPHHQEQASSKQKRSKKKNPSKQGIRVPVMPLPRSKSFHQILRPTANGHILASNGTIRGASKQKLVAKSNRDLVVDEQQSVQPLASRVKQLFGPKTSNKSKDYSSNEKCSELESIWQARLSKSESNLHYRHVNRAPSVDLIAEQNTNHYYYNQPLHHPIETPHLFHNQQEDQQQRRSSESCRKPEKPQRGGNKGHRNSPSQFKSSVPAVTKACYVPNSANVNGGNHGGTTQPSTHGHAYTSASPVRTGRASKEGSISKHSAVASAGNVGAVAAKIQRVKQHRNQIVQVALVDKSKSAKQCDLLPLSKMVPSYLSSSTQEISNDITSNQNHNIQNSGDHVAKNCKIKRSVSNFDASVYFRQHDTSSTALSGTTIDSPWKLQKPNYDVNTKNGAPDWYSQYLSFEFLNERIKSRLQEEINHQRRSLATDNSSVYDYSRFDSAYQTSRSEDSKQHPIASRCFDREASKLSCSETNLNTPNTPKTKAKGSNGLGKRKSFKKLIEQYFVHNNSSCDSSTSSLVSSPYATELSTFAQFDQNFILKRNTPNAGLLEQKFQQQSNIKEYFDNEQSIYDKTWKKKRSSQSSHSSNAQCQANNRNNFSTIDRQLQMFENILNQAENQLADHDELIMQLGDSNGLHKSNLSLAEQANFSEYVQSNANSSNSSSQLQYLKLIGKSDNSLCANNIKFDNKTKKSGQHHRDYYNQNTGLYWTPLNDLSSESEYEDEADEIHNETIHQPESTVTEVLVDNLVDIEVEDFNCHQFRAVEAPVPMPRQHIAAIATNVHTHQQSSKRNNIKAYKQTVLPQNQLQTSRKNSIHQLPSGPCFTLSNQLKTLLHNSNRLKSQNYFFY